MFAGSESISETHDGDLVGARFKVPTLMAVRSSDSTIYVLDDSARNVRQIKIGVLTRRSLLSCVLLHIYCCVRAFCVDSNRDSVDIDIWVLMVLHCGHRHSTFWFYNNRWSIDSVE